MEELDWVSQRKSWPREALVMCPSLFSHRHRAHWCLSVLLLFSSLCVGLAIVKNIVAHMHGSIHVTSQQGKGSKFSLHLPIECRRPGGPDEQGEDEAELHSTVNRLRALHHAEEEEEDLIESQLLDKFERSHDYGGGAGIGSGGSNQSSHSESDGDGSRMVPKTRGTGSPPTFRPAHPSAALRAEVHRALTGAPMLPQVPRRADLSPELSSASSPSKSSDGQSNSSRTMHVTFHDTSMSRSGSLSKRAREALMTRQPEPEQVEANPSGASLPALAPVSTAIATTPASASIVSTPVVNTPLALDLLVASKIDPLTSNLLWPVGSSSSAPSSAHSQTRGLPPSPVLYLLLVDDAEVNLKILQKMLGSSIVVAGTKYKLVLTTASNGLDAMQKVEERWQAAQGPAAAADAVRQPAAFDAILSDIVMPLAGQNTASVHIAPSARK